MISPRRTGVELYLPLVIVTAWLVFFADPLFSSKNFYFRDILNFHYPLRKVLIDSYSRGEFPLWSPYLYFGQPMLANPNYMAFYPTNLLHAIVPFDYAFKLHFILQPLLGGLGMYLLQRRLGIVPLAAVGGSIAYQFSGTVLSFLNLYTFVPAVALIPWSCWSFLWSMENNRIGRRLVLGFILGLHILSFDPILFQCNLYFLAGVGTLHVLGSDSRRRAALDVMRTALVGVAFGMALAAVQVLPTLELLPHSARGAGFEYTLFSGWSMHPMDMLNIFVPSLFGDPYTIDRSTYWGEVFHRGREGYLVSVFLGTATCFLSFLSIMSARKRLKWALGILLLVSLVLALGEFNPVFRWLYDLIPLLRLGRYPSKYLLLGTLCLTILAALGMEVLLRASRDVNERRKFLTLAVVGGLLGIGLLGLWGYSVVSPLRLESWIKHSIDPSLVGTKDVAAIASNLIVALRSSGLFLLTSAVLAISSVFWRDMRMLGWTMVLLLAAELMSANLRLLPLISVEDLQFVPEVFQYFRTERFPKHFRVAPTALMGVVPDQRVLAPNRSLVWLHRLNRLRGDPIYGIIHGVQYSLDESIDSLNTRESQKLWEAFMNLPVSKKLAILARLNSPVVLSLVEVEDPRVRLIRTFDTRSEHELKMYWLENTITRAFFTPRAERVASPQEALGKVLDTGFSYGGTAVLETDLDVRHGLEEATGRVEIVEYRNGRVICEVDAQTPGYVVLLDSYYPGWRASVDGKEKIIIRTNYAFRAVEVPAGRHRVEFRYQPKFFYTGLAVTCLALAFGLAVVFRVILAQ